MPGSHDGAHEGDGAAPIDAPGSDTQVDASHRVDASTRDGGSLTGVDCGGVSCGADEVCCLSYQLGQAHLACAVGSCPQGSGRVSCDGPEDCAGGEDCCFASSGEVTCMQTCTGVVLCRQREDCPESSQVCCPVPNTTANVCAEFVCQ